MKLTGYKRPTGVYGIRNIPLVIPTSVCAANTAQKIADQVPGAVALSNQHGCCQIGSDLAQTEKVLVGFGRNANVGGVLVVSLGCDGIIAKNIAERIEPTGKPVKHLTIQDEGGTLKTIARGAEILRDIASEISKQPRVEMGLENIIIGQECGGSDPTSGLVSNPTIGLVSDRVVEAGGFSILSETTEVIGAEHILAERFADSNEKQKFLDFVNDTEQRALDLGEDLRSGQPTPGNKEGGLTTIEEKSLGCMHKAGSAPFEGALKYAEEINYDKPGLYFMDSPGQDIDSISGMIASGATVILFSTGRGTPTGSPISPVIKLTGNSDTYAKMSDNIDIDASAVIDEGKSIEEMGDILFNEMIEVANGKLTRAESLGHQEFGIWKVAATF